MRPVGSVRRSESSPYLRFLALNVVVSAVTMLIVLAIWDRRPAGRAALTPTATINVGALVATALPTPTATLPPSPTPATYTVQPGDTLFHISQVLGIDMEAIMAANGITDPNTLDVGQVLRIPQVESGSPAEPRPPLPEGGSLPSATPNPDVQSPRVQIREVSGRGNLETETVLLLNTGGQADMTGWTIDDGRGHRYTFPNFILHNDGAVNLHTKAGIDNPIDLYWGLTQAVWLPGTTVTLRDANGQVHDTFRIPE